MEERMDRRTKFRFIGLLRISGFFFLFSLFSFPLAAQETQEDNLNVLVETSPANPITGSSWTLTILVDHPASQEVRIQPPYFPSGLILERVRSSIRIYRPSNAPENSANEESSRWTAIEYLFTAQAAGNFLLEPFEVSVGARQNHTAPITVQVRAPAQVQRQPPSFRWERIPSTMTAGNAVELVLILSNWDSSRPAPQNLFRGRIPENSIIEEMPFIREDRLIRYPIRIIPLEKGTFNLNALVIQHEGERLEIPRISVSVVESGSLPDRITQQVQLLVQEDNGSESPFEPPETFIEETSIFPLTNEKVFPLFQKEYEEVISQAAVLWENGSFAQALAFVRMNERDRVFGKALVSLRRNMEAKLGLDSSLEGAMDEKRNFFILPLLICIGLVVAALIAWKVTSRLRKGFIQGTTCGSITALILGGAGILFLLIILAGYLRDSFTESSIPVIMTQDYSQPGKLAGNSAVLKSTEVYRVPDLTGAVVFEFDEGQAVTIRSSPGTWVHVESPDGRSGWVPAESVIPY